MGLEPGAGRFTPTRRSLWRGVFDLTSRGTRSGARRSLKYIYLRTSAAQIQAVPLSQSAFGMSLDDQKCEL